MMSAMDIYLTITLMIAFLFFIRNRGKIFDKAEKEGRK